MGLEDKVDIFYKIYLNCSAIIQIFDDIGDVEDDVKNGHYSFPILLLNKDNRDNKGCSTEDIVNNESLMKTIREHLLQLIEECEALGKEHSLPIFPFLYLVQALKARILLVF
jgi:geranylgeranyl pyrophosphate synthase